MSCFVVPLVQAIATSAIRKAGSHTEKHTALGRQLPALEKMLWGGSVMLIVDHIINGALTWRFPFFTVLETGGASAMLREILTVGVPMSVAITLVWIIYALVKERRHPVATTQVQ